MHVAREHSAADASMSAEGPRSRSIVPLAFLRMRPAVLLMGPESLLSLGFPLSVSALGAAALRW